jgi:hypothetical protein
MAAVPNNPRSINIQWFEPFQSAFCRRILKTHITVATEQRKKSTSMTGMWLTCFTKIFAKAKKSVEKNIERTPLLRNVRSWLKPVKRIVFLICRRNRSQRRSPIFLKMNAFDDRMTARRRPMPSKLSFRPR